MVFKHILFRPAWLELKSVCTDQVDTLQGNNGTMYIVKAHPVPNWLKNISGSTTPPLVINKQNGTHNVWNSLFQLLSTHYHPSSDIILSKPPSFVYPIISRFILLLFQSGTFTVPKWQGYLTYLHAALSKYVRDQINILLVFSPAISPLPVENTGIYISCRRCVWFIKERDDAEENGPVEEFKNRKKAK